MRRYCCIKIIVYRLVTIISPMYILCIFVTRTTLQTNRNHVSRRKVWRYQRGNQKLQMEDGQTKT